jgi:DNA polymerase III subunit alpha, Gram-positive type
LQKFELFKQQVNLAEELLKHVQLMHVEVHRQARTWTLHIELDQALEAKFIEELTAQLKLYFKVPQIQTIHIKIQYQPHVLTDSNAIKQYVEYSLFQLIQQKPSINVLKNYQFEVNYPHVTFHIDESSMFLNDYLTQLQKEILMRFQLELLVTSQVQTSLPKTTDLIQDAKKASEHILIEQKKQFKQVEREVVKQNVFKTKRRPDAMKIKDIPIDQYRFDQYKNTNGQTDCIIEGEVLSVEIQKLTKTELLKIVLMDEEDAILVKRFLNQEKDKAFALSIEEGQFLQINGYFEYDSYARDIVVQAKSIGVIEVEQVKRVDLSKQKRIEFHIHTKMSNLDGITEVKDYVNLALQFEHKAIAFTDHNGLYAFPDIEKATKGKPIKAIYGVELDTVDTDKFYVIKDVKNDHDMRDLTYVVFDIETTGLSVMRDHIIEIAAVKVEKGMIVETFHQFVDPQMPLSAFTTSLTSITDEMVKGQPLIAVALSSFLTFAKNSVLVAHNASFDVDFIVEKARIYQISLEYEGYIDTLSLARAMYQDQLKTFNLKSLAKQFKIKQEQHHRASDDARVLADIWLFMLQDLSQKGFKKVSDYMSIQTSQDVYRYPMPFHLNLLVKEQKGLKNLYLIVSDALTDHFHKGARATKEVIQTYRDGLLVGSGCYKGEVFEAALNKSQLQLEKVMSFYDYIEVQPPSAYQHLIEDLGEDGESIIQSIIKRIMDTAQKLNKLIIATGDVHYLNEEDQKYRDIYIRTPQVGGGLHDLKRYQTMPLQHFRATHEMLDAFDFLGEEAETIVIKNTQLLNEMIDPIQLFPSGLLSIQDDAFDSILGISSISNEVRRIVLEQLRIRYGEHPHPIVSERVMRELNNIIDNQFAPIYYMSHLLVKNSLDEGYLVGSRGSVGSSLVATLMNITEVNPLKPHYVCKEGHFTAFHLTDEEQMKYGFQPHEKEFQSSFKNVFAGFDLKKAMCPICQQPLLKDGHDIPFETFLGFDGDKTPDIDLNFSGEYQAKAHQYVKTLVGEDQAYRAGTIQTIAERNAFGYVKGYLEDHHLEKRPSQIQRMAKKIEGVKRSTGQHPGGIIVVPQGYTIYDVTPVQYPADQIENSWKTTHFDYHAFESNLLKLDILGHDDPTMIKFLMDYVNEHPSEFPFKEAVDIPLDDPSVMKLFSETEVIGVSEQDLMSDIASFAIPEFNTKFTRQMLSRIKPKSFAELVKVSGLSHGTDVWLKNAEDLILGKTQFATIPFNQIIGCRDDIMVQLSDFGLEPIRAFEIMEFVRKGKPSKEYTKWLNYESEMRLSAVPEWYIWSCKQIKYMFPKAHATAYVMMAVRIAWFKIHKPLLFYSAYFSKRADKFDYEKMLAGPQAIKNGIKALQSNNRLTAKDESILTSLQVAYEMTLRGFKFLKIDINHSDASLFIMEENGLRMPFNALDGLGESVAQDIILKRQERAFTSKEDVVNRTKINQTLFAKLDEYGAFDSIIVDNNGIEHGLFAL